MLAVYLFVFYKISPSRYAVRRLTVHLRDAILSS
jgi:hypothetical protein